MKIEMIDIARLRPYPSNARTHSDEQIDQIAASIREFGFTNPVLIDASHQIIAGHGRVEAARRIEMWEVPCLRLDELDDAQRRAYIIADNKLAENSGWDMSLLRIELGDLDAEGFDCGLLGFSEEELENLLKPVDGSGDSDGEAEETFSLSISSKDEAEIIALRRLLGLRKNANKVEASKVLALLPI